MIATARARWALWLAYAALVVVATLHHEPWRDEAQAWLIARDLALPGVFEQMGWEGSPALWHVLLFPLAQLGAPYWTEAALHVLLALASGALLVGRAPFPLWLTALLLGSSYLSYEYAAIARNYAPTVLLLCALAALHPRRRARPRTYAVLVALLANTNVHSLALAAGLAALHAHDLLRAEERPRARKVAGAVAIALAGLAAALLQLAPSAAQNHLVGPGLHVAPLAPLAAIRNAWLPGLPPATMPLALALMLLVAVAAWRWARASFGLLVCGLAGLFVIFALKHPGGLRHHGLVMVFTVFVLWLAWPQLAAPAARRWRQALLVALGAALAAGLPFSVRVHVADLRGRYSGAPAMAAYIAAADLAGRPLVAYDAPAASAILPYLPEVTPWYAEIEAPATFVTWDRRWAENRHIGVDAAARRATRAPGWGPGALLLLSAPLPAPERFDLRLRHAVDDVFNPLGERLYLYERGPAD